MSKHTAGPWRYVRGNGSPTTGMHMIAGATPGYLAEVRDCGSGDVAANARLMAAAPRLAAVLERLLLIINESAGVAGYHLNGAIAEWDEFEEITEASAALEEALNADT